MTGSDKITVALAGNPNAGKTSVFNALTGARQHVGNYPGVTVEKKEGRAFIDGREVHVVDLPGTYSLTAYSLEELVARDFIMGERPDVVIDVVDSSNLERNLYLAIQLLELGVPLVICLNMTDVAEQRGIHVDPEKLGQLLGAPVVPTVARGGKGMKELLKATVDLAWPNPTWDPLKISYGPDVDRAIDELSDILQGSRPRRGLISPHWLAVKFLEGDPEILNTVDEESELGRKLFPLRKRLAHHILATTDDDPESIIADYRYGFIGGVCRQAVKAKIREHRLDTSDRIDRVLTNRLIGPLVLLLVLYGIYQFVFVVSETPVAWFGLFFSWLGSSVEAIIPDGMFQSLIVSGVIDGVGGVLGFVPLIMFMFFAVAFLEDSGYMARVAYMMDRLLRTFGLHGNSVMAMIVSGGIAGGCAVPGVMATRVLKDPKARLATILTVSMMNCGAKLPLYAVLVGAFFSGRRAEIMFALTLISWGIVLVAARILRWTALRGESAPFVMELPLYRLPTTKGLFIHTWERTWQYIKKAGTVILGISVLIWALMSFPGMPSDQAAMWDDRIRAAENEEVRMKLSAEKARAGLAHSAAGRMGRALTHVTAPLGFDWRTNVALVGGFAAKEVVVSTLGTAYSIGEVDAAESEGLSTRLKNEPGWTPLKAFALMIFVMVYAPCFVTVVMIRRETGSTGWALFSIVYTTALAYALTFLVYQGGRLVGLQ
ncbi:MAG: ferrous iron transport protein B [Deltaproteobacteria bacterium]|nr:ferrous iron transport protein B [Deltaproteobacteria bacterium]